MAAALVVLAITPSCTSPTDALYDAPEPPWSPARPDLERQDACTTCARDACSDERTACLEDTACLPLLECRGRCQDPTCLQACTAEHGYSPWYDDLWRCALFERCTEPCGSGRNFACVDAYPAPHAESESFTARFEYRNPFTGLAYAFQGDARDEQFMAGAEARSCLHPDLASSACQVLDSATVGPDDVFELGLRRHPTTLAWKGVVEVTLESEPGAGTDPNLFRQLGTRDRYFMPPLAADTDYRFYVFWRGWFREAAFTASLQQLDFATAAPLAIYLEDCMGTPASGVRFELELPEDEADAVTVLHQRADGSFGDRTDTGSAMIADLPDSLRSQAVEVRAVTDDGDEVARRNDVFVRKGATTHVWLTPSAE